MSSDIETPYKFSVILEQKTVHKNSYAYILQGFRSFYIRWQKRVNISHNKKCP